MTQSFLFRTPPLPPEFPLFDVHVHLGPSDTGEIFYPHLRGEEYLALMKASNIEQAVAFAPLRNDGYAAANRSLLAWTETTRCRIRAFARLGGSHKPVTVPQVWMLRRKLAGWLNTRAPDIDDLEDLKYFAGVKMLPHMDGLVDDAVYARINELRLPVLVHGGTHSPARFIAEKIASRVAGPLIVAHCGAFPCDAAAFYDAIEMARRHDNIYLDTSGVVVSEFLRHAVQAIPEKLLFGSDAPLSHPLVAWHHLASVVHDDATLERIGGKNARDLLA